MQNKLAQAVIIKLDQDMKIIINQLILTILLVATSSLAYAGGGWPQPKGQGYLKLSQWWVTSNQHFTDVGLIDPNITMGIFNTSLYAEYGLTDRITGVVYLPFFSRAIQNNEISGTTQEIITPGDAINGVGDTDISLKFGITNPAKGLAVAATMTFGIPLGENAGGVRQNLQLGDGEFNQMLTVDAGSGWQAGSIPMYANAYLGYNNRTKGFSDEVRYGAEIGANIANKKLWIIARMNAVESTKNGDERPPANSTSIFANNTEFLSIGGEVAYNITDKWGVSASYMSALRGEIIFASPSYSFGVFTKF